MQFLPNPWERDVSVTSGVQTLLPCPSQESPLAMQAGTRTGMLPSEHVSPSSVCSCVYGYPVPLAEVSPGSEKASRPQQEGRFPACCPAAAVL